MEIQDLDLTGTPPDNSDPAPDGFPENMPFGGVNDSARELMAAIKRRYLDSNGSLVSGGAADAQTLATNATYSGLVTGTSFRFRAGFTNATTAPTLNVGIGGARPVVRGDGNALAVGDIAAGDVYDVVYDATLGTPAWKLVGRVAPLSQATLRLTATALVTLASTGHAFQIGADASPNLAMDPSSIQARDNGTAVPLELQPEGGAVSMGDATGLGLLASGNEIQALFAAAAVLMRLNAAGGDVAVGPGGAGLEVRIGSASIDAQNNGTASTLDINPSGGDVIASGSLDVVDNLDVGLNLDVVGDADVGGVLDVVGRITGLAGATARLLEGNGGSQLSAGAHGTLTPASDFNRFLRVISGTTSVDLPPASAAGDFVLFGLGSNGSALTVTASGGAAIRGSTTVADDSGALYLALTTTSWLRVF